VTSYCLALSAKLLPLSLPHHDQSVNGCLLGTSNFSRHDYPAVMQKVTCVAPAIILFLATAGADRERQPTAIRRHGRHLRDPALLSDFADF
jgi:hypothetical protein